PSRRRTIWSKRSRPSSFPSRGSSYGAMTSAPSRPGAARRPPESEAPMIIPLPSPDRPTDATEVAPVADIDDGDLLDAYSKAVSTAAELLIPSVASLRVTRQMGG